jgi:phenylpropionate dioxygenase-like ring-hydroxylating dioxygenase large terminal subunit
MDLSTPSSVRSATAIGPGPPADQFPIYPQSWYWFCSADQLRRGPLTRRLFGRELVAFRTASGQVGVLDARCCHLGADLGRGRVVGEEVQCPYHHWQYGVDGRCTHVPAQKEAPPFARQRSYPAAMRHGQVYFFCGHEPLFPLPFHAGCHPEDFAAGRRLHFVADCTWYMLAANNCDVQHWNTTHDRRLLAAPVADFPHPYARRIRFSTAVVGTSLFDRCLRRFAGDPVDVSITNWGGTFFTVTGSFRRAQSRLIVAARPSEDGEQTILDVFVFVQRWRRRWLGGLLEPVSLWVRRLFTWGFMHEEFRRLAGIRYSPHTLIDSDREMLDFFHWAAALPRESAPPQHQERCCTPSGTANGRGPLLLEEEP